jgi:hypothetical protein
MNRYIITLATELDGHAGATTAFVNSEIILTRSKALELVDQICGKDAVFKESPNSFERQDPAYYYGEMVSYMKTKQKDNLLEYRTPVAIAVMKLPARMTKNKVYITDSRTG